MAIGSIDRDLTAFPAADPDGPGQAWEAVLLVCCPIGTAFSRTAGDPECREVTRWRTVTVTEAVLQPTLPWASL
ncbi:hypothetical protein [Micromonospora tulbaghiae]|uniref:hypothetical protein n=1 Tax=Micromonospora tulbaghiae TaxID=479978 RepID=UPI00341C1DD7